MPFVFECRRCRSLASHGGLREELALLREDTGARKHQGAFVKRCARGEHSLWGGDKKWLQQIDFLIISRFKSDDIQDHNEFDLQLTLPLHL